MQLKTLYVRFYKSFNYDYLRRYRDNARHFPWEDVDGRWYPFVRVPIDQEVTTIVGANESGKTHLLTAIEKGVSGEGIQRGDFCRYSQFFSVEQGKARLPDFGFEWTLVSDRDRQLLHELKLEIPPGISTITSFRRGLDWDIYLPSGSDFKKHTFHGDEATNFGQALPYVFRIDPNVALPDSVPIQYLAGRTTAAGVESFRREDRFSIWEALEPIASTWTPESASTPQATNSVTPALIKAWASAHRDERGHSNGSSALARDLICKVAKTDAEALGELYNALREGKEGYAQGLIERINGQLAAHLNFPKWWVQDRDFALRVAPREFDLVFTIRDRTGTEYSFGERSHGLKYFLSYYVQYLAHTPSSDRDEILVMDEPDTFLSSQAQQDLVRVLAAFARPEDGQRPVQVVYVTHSPFLIDKNHADRIRVLEKGGGDEGTRVVRDAAKNHYEPLRSAFGAFVAETTFIGTCNLMVEGQADQVLLAGASAFMRTRGATGWDVLDLNRLTIVPAGSASHVPYLVYLARGRDVERPAVVVLLDSDESGDIAAKELQRGGPRRKQLLDPKFVIRIGEVDGIQRTSMGPAEIEDLIPAEICVAAMARYIDDLAHGEEAKQAFTVQALTEKYGAGLNTWDALTQISESLADKIHVDKVAFARAAIESLTAVSDGARDAFETNVTALFRVLNDRQRSALKLRAEATLKDRIDRARKGFLSDHATTATRQDALLLLSDIEEVLDDSAESDAIKTKLQEIRREFTLNDEIGRPVERFAELRTAIEQIKYIPKLSTQDNHSPVDPAP